jgi:hypothetical protein
MGQVWFTVSTVLPLAVLGGDDGLDGGALLDVLFVLGR